MVCQASLAKCSLLFSATIMCLVLAIPTEFENRASKPRHNLFDTLLKLRAQKSTLPSFVNVTMPSDTASDGENAQSEVLQQLQLEHEEEEHHDDDVAMNREGSTFLKKPTKYHYYPHNQHLYLLPECATQQVCNAVYTRLNYTQPLCACPDRFSTPCSADLGTNDRHTLQVSSSQPTSKKSVTLIKTCESTSQIRECRAPQDWALLALQNVRTGKSQFLVICRCPERHNLEGPMSHDQPAYARVPGIRVYGMMCNAPHRRTYVPQIFPSKRNLDNSTTNDSSRRKRTLHPRTSSSPPFPWKKALEFAQRVVWD